jgi:uncharacterized protein (DUF433 family)
MDAAPTALLDRPVYAIPQVDRLLGLKSGTSRRWIEGYSRGGKDYPPIVRVEATGDEIVTWGEFVETRLLSEYRDSGVTLHRLRPAIDKLRERFDARYPLAYSQPFLDVHGRELVEKTQQEVHLEGPLQLVVIRNDQLVLAQPAQHFVQSVDYQEDSGVAERIHPAPDLRHVVIDPLRQFGEPVVRSVPTEIIAEQIRAGDPLEMIAELYELTPDQVLSAIRYELLRGKPATDAAA